MLDAELGESPVVVIGLLAKALAEAVAEVVAEADKMVAEAVADADGPTKKFWTYWTVYAWFFLVDAISGRPLSTCSRLGTVTLQMGDADDDDIGGNVF